MGRNATHKWLGWSLVGLAVLLSVLGLGLAFPLFGIAAFLLGAAAMTAGILLIVQASDVTHQEPVKR